MDNVTDVTIAILAGGQSRRMGQDKSLLPLRGQPMIAHVLARVRGLNLPTIIIANQPERYQRFGLPVFGDVLPQSGSLVGLHSALTHSQTAYTLCLACDMPLVNADVLRSLIARRHGFKAVVPQLAAGPEPLHAVYHRHCLTLIEAQIARQEFAISKLYRQLYVQFVEEAELRAFDPDLHSFTNANTSDDLARLETLL